MSGPTVHVTHEHAEGHVVVQILHVRISVFGHRTIVEHQVDARYHGDQKHQKGQSAHAPRKAHAHGMAPYLGRMEVQKHVGGHHHDPVSRRVFVTVAKDGFPNVALHDVAFDFI